MSWLYYTILYYTILYYNLLYFTINYYTILYYNMLYYTRLYYTMPCYAPAQKGSTNLITYPCVPKACSTDCLGHGAWI